MYLLALPAQLLKLLSVSSGDRYLCDTFLYRLLLTVRSTQGIAELDVACTLGRAMPEEQRRLTVQEIETIPSKSTSSEYWRRGFTSNGHKPTVQRSVRCRACGLATQRTLQLQVRSKETIFQCLRGAWLSVRIEAQGSWAALPPCILGVFK